MYGPFEQLEDRRLMSVSLVATPVIMGPLYVASPLTVNGTGGADSISISHDASGNLVVNNDGAVSTYTDMFVSSIVVNAGAGNDSVWVADNINHPMVEHGGSGNDLLFGGNLNDQIDGGGDTDTIYGMGGDDQLDGGVAGNYYWDNTGNDVLYGGDGNDTVTASDYGNNTLDGGNGNDVLYGMGGNDVLRGGWGDDWMYGGTGNDVLTGYTGNDHLYGQDGNDTLRGEWDNDVVCGGNGDDVLHGDSGDDQIYGEAGNDRLYGDAGADLLCGGDGDDVLVSVGGGQSDTLWGQAGFDSFWADSEGSEVIADAEWSEIINSNVHRVSSFMTERFTNGSVWPWDWQYQSPGRDANGDNFRDPSGGSNYANFSGNPLFSTSGPSKDDIDQNALGDCYFLATLSAIAKVNPNRIRQSVVELGDGTYAVRFNSGGTETYLRVDGDLPTNGMGSPSYAGMGIGNSTWVAVLEKAWAHFRRNEGSYPSIESGWMEECFGAMNTSTTSQDVDWWYKAWNNKDNLWQYVSDRLSEGRAVTIGTNGDATALVGSHAYMVDSVYYSGSTKMVRLRNPWGAAGNPGAYMDITAQQLFDSINKVQSAYV